jgi:hypothetical protein
MARWCFEVGLPASRGRMSAKSRGKGRAMGGASTLLSGFEVSRTWRHGFGSGVWDLMVGLGIRLIEIALPRPRSNTPPFHMREYLPLDEVAHPKGAGREAS